MNRLAQESSPYLLQHADNPVDWWPWCPEAFAEAAARGVPVLLSVGYSTCHWCHVMAHESFEDETVATIVNAQFVPIKVDREERPDIDALYMQATQAMTGEGGWPMTVFLTPQGEPFYAGTYFPPEDYANRPSFTRVLLSVAQAWDTDRQKVLQNAQVMTQFLQASTTPAGQATWPDDFLERGISNLSRAFDPQWGGFGTAPKFPAPTTLDFLLTQPQGRQMALHTLDMMGRGGIHDHLGGGFHRYSVDQRWLVPHFEKMLYDNAQLVRTLLRAYQYTGNAEYERLARETLVYLEREMQDGTGGFYSAQDADTPTEHGGVEGLTFTWTPDEVREVLGDAGLFLQATGTTDEGNFTDPHQPQYGRRTVLHLPRPLPEVADELGIPEDELRRELDVARLKLLEARAKRPQPQTDRKMLTSWNGLALGAFADAARILLDGHYLDIAQRNAEWVRQSLRQPSGTLFHTYKDGQAKVGGLLEDHALYGLGLVALYQASGKLETLHWAQELWHIVKRDFWDEAQGVFYSTGGEAETLLARQVQTFDSAVMSDTAAAAQLGLWMARYGLDAEGERIARRVVTAYNTEMLAAVGGFGGLWQVAAMLEAPPSELALIGAQLQRLPLQQVVARYALPFTALAPADAPAGLPVLEGREGEGMAYLCVNHACQLPARDAETLEQQLRAFTEG